MLMWQPRARTCRSPISPASLCTCRNARSSENRDGAELTGNGVGVQYIRQSIRANCNNKSAGLPRQVTLAYSGES